MEENITHNRRLVYKNIRVFIFGSSKNLKFIEILIKKSCDHLLSFFETSHTPKQLKLFLLSSRKNLDLKMKQRTPEWLAAYSFNGSIYILSPESFEAESTHKKAEFKKILTHELTHIFIEQINKNSLRCLDEGLALNLSKQTKNNTISKDNWLYFMENHLTKNGLLNNFSEREGYKISYWVVKYYLDKYSKDKILELLKLGSKFHINRFERILNIKIENLINDIEKKSLRLT